MFYAIYKYLEHQYYSKSSSGWNNLLFNRGGFYNFNAISLLFVYLMCTGAGVWLVWNAKKLHLERDLKLYCQTRFLWWYAQQFLPNCLSARCSNASSITLSQYTCKLILTPWMIKTRGEQPFPITATQPITEAGACLRWATCLFKLSLDLPSSFVLFTYCSVTISNFKCF